MRPFWLFAVGWVGLKTLRVVIASALSAAALQSKHSSSRIAGVPFGRGVELQRRKLTRAHWRRQPEQNSWVSMFIGRRDGR